MHLPAVSCNLGDIALLAAELARDANNFGVGVINIRTGEIRIFTYDETDAFSKTNLHLQVMAGHEAATAIAGFSLADTRGFVVGLQANAWHLFNLSHLNRADAQPNSMRMTEVAFQGIVSALKSSGVTSLVAQ